MAEEQLSPISAAKPPAVNPLGTPSHASTLKLKPVIRKPVAGGAARPGLKLPTRPAVVGARPAAAPAAPAAAPATPAPAAGGDSVSQLQTVTQKLKGITQKLKGVTQQIPQQAILRKTGIIADQNLTEAQKQASKSRTARISLSDALGVAPVKDEAAPMKTIRIKRPDLPAAKPAVKPPAAAEEPAPQAPADAPQGADQSLTQRKTLKISRPGGGVRPGGAKFALKKPGAPAAAKDGAAPAEGGDVPEMDVPEMPAAAPAFTPYGPRSKDDDGVAGVPGGLLVFDFILQFAACIAVGFLGWLLYTDLNTTWF